MWSCKELSTYLALFNLGSSNLERHVHAQRERERVERDEEEEDMFSTTSTFTSQFRCQVTQSHLLIITKITFLFVFEQGQ
jgi:hypothetical protein